LTRNGTFRDDGPPHGRKKNGKKGGGAVGRVFLPFRTIWELPEGGRKGEMGRGG